MATITARGHATLPVEPDLVELVLVVSATAATPDEAFTEVTQRGRAVEEVLDAAGVPRERRMTVGLDVHEHTEYDGRGGSRVSGYRAFGRTLVELEDPAGVAPLITEAVRNARAQIEGPFWRVRGDHPARLEVCARAADAARERAASYARQLGCELGALVGAVEPGTTEAHARTARGAVLAPAMDYPVEAGRVEVAAELDVTYELREAP